MQLPAVVRTMVDAAVDAVAVVGPDLEVLYFNSAYVQLSGLRVRALRSGMERGVCHEHFGLETCDEGCISVRAMRAGRAIRVDEVTSHTRPLRLIVVATPLLDDDGNVYAVMESYRDVTAESRLQNEYRRLLEAEREDKRRLAQQAERQLGQRNDELREANRKLERANSAKSRFLASMSHEIRTPLSGVIGIAQLLADTELDGAQRQLVQTLCSSGDALMGLISDILDFSKIEAERLEIEHIVFSLRAVVEGAAYVFAPQAQERGVEFIIQIDASVPDAFIGDPRRIQQVLMNLCSNAVKFTSTGHVAIEVSVDPSTRDVVLEVVDSGVGIPVDRRHRLFQPFSQVDDTNSRRYGGTGLGLAISKRLAEKMGGDITVDSVEGEGSTFRLSVPLEVSSELGQLRPPALSDTLRIGVVDADPRRRRSVVHALDWLGVAAGAFASLDEALQAPALPSALFVALPVPDEMRPALELLRGQPEVALIGVTSLSEQARRDRMDGWDDYVTRPTKASEVAEVVGRLVRGADPPPVPWVEAGVDRTALRGRCTILIVEDSPVNQMILSTALRKAGYQVELARHGREAVEACEVRDYDLVLMDCQMPEMDGFEATRRIRRRERREGGRTHIVALTANVTVPDREACVAAGMDGYMTKPFQIAEIVARLDEQLLWLGDQASGVAG